MWSVTLATMLVVVFFKPIDARAQTTDARGAACDRYHLSAVPLSTSKKIKLDTEAEEISSIRTEDVGYHLKQKIKEMMTQPNTDVRNAKMRYLVRETCLKVDQDPALDIKLKFKIISSIDNSIYLLYLEKKWHMNEPTGTGPTHHHAPENDIVEPRRPDDRPETGPAK